LELEAEVEQGLHMGFLRCKEAWRLVVEKGLVEEKLVEEQEHAKENVKDTEVNEGAKDME